MNYSMTNLMANSILLLSASQVLWAKSDMIPRAFDRALLCLRVVTSWSCIPLIQSCSNLPFIDHGRIFIWESLEERDTMDAYHLAKQSGNFGWRSNGTVIFRKIRSEIVKYLQRWSFSFVRNGTAGIYCLYLPFAKFSRFQSLVSRKLLRQIELQIVSTISSGWFADFGKTLTII